MRALRSLRRHRAAPPAPLALLVSALIAAPPLGAQPRLRASDVDTMTLATPGERIAYGPDSLHFGELRLPPGRGPFPVAVVVHGGCWISRFATLRNSAPLADGLTAAGVATWNVEYRRADLPGGGYPGTLTDVAAAVDHLRALARRHPIDTTRVVFVGHSAGGQLALWLASRPRLPAGSPLRVGTPLRPAGVVTVGAVVDLVEFGARQRTGCGTGVPLLIGGAPDTLPQRVRELSPIAFGAIGVPHAHLAGAFDAIAPDSVLQRYARVVRTGGDSVHVEIIADAGHFDPMAPTRPAGRRVIDVVRALLRLPR